MCEVGQKSSVKRRLRSYIWFSITGAKSQLDPYIFSNLLLRLGADWLQIIFFREVEKSRNQETDFQLRWRRALQRNIPANKCRLCATRLYFTTYSFEVKYHRTRTEELIWKEFDVQMGRPKASDISRNVASLFASIVTVPSNIPNDWVARTGDHSIFNVLSHLIPKVLGPFLAL